MIYFLSDIHLGAAYMPDRKAHEAKVVAFLQSIERDAERLYLLGDILDYWFEYRDVVPRGYVRFFGQLARMADRGTEIVWFTGNHDIWLFDYLRDEIGITVVDTPAGGIPVDIDGTRFFLGHGDNFGRQPRSYTFLRALFHNRLCQRLYASLHPRWTIPFAHGWSAHSRLASAPSPSVPAISPRARAAVETFARSLADADPALRYIIIGHHHLPLAEQISPDCRLVILGNWIDRATYASFDGKEVKLHEYDRPADTK